MEGHAVALHQGDEVLCGVARQGTAGEQGVLAQKVFVRGLGIDVFVGEVAAPAARDADFFGQFGVVVDQHHRQTLLGGNPRAKQACCASAHDGHIAGVHGLAKKASIMSASAWGWSWCSMCPVSGRVACCNWGTTLARW